MHRGKQCLPDVPPEFNLGYLSSHGDQNTTKRGKSELCSVSTWGALMSCDSFTKSSETGLGLTADSTALLSYKLKSKISDASQVVVIRM